MVPNTIVRFYTTANNLQFKILENINQFLRAAREFGVKLSDLFIPTDLTEKKYVTFSMYDFLTT